MPTYVYACPRCGEIEREQSISAPALTACPQCGAPVERLISGGSGFLMKRAAGGAGACDRETPCCGRATRCARPPCHH